MKKLRGFMSDCLGFTTTEAIVSCLVVTITGAIAASAYSALMPGYRLKAAARDLYSHMQQSKFMAVKNKTDCRIIYSTNPDRYFVSGTTKTVTLQDYGSGVMFKGPAGQTYSVPTITFNSRGFSNSGYAYLTNAQNTTYYRVGLSWSTGAVRIQQYGPDGWN
jgi:Tfp pilus assembly protein FimT